MPPGDERLALVVLGEPEGALVESVAYWDSEGDNVGAVRAPGDAGWEISREGFVPEFAECKPFGFVNIYLHTSSFLIEREHMVEDVVNVFIVLKKQDSVVCKLGEFVGSFIDFNTLDFRIVSN